MINRLILFAVALLWITGATAQTASIKKDITLDDVVKNWTFYPNSIDELTSMNDGLSYTVLEGDTAIVKYSYKTGKKAGTLVTVSQFNYPKITSFRNYQFNADESKIIFYINRQNIYRRSFTADYFVWDLKLKKLYPVSTQPGQRLATLSPDGTKVAFVRENNLFITEIQSGIETAVTTDGKFNKIINGAPDWVYEEEFEYNQAFCWSPDGKYLAYCRFDESKVRTYNFTLFAGMAPKLDENSLYPFNYSYKYPKAGEDNSVVSVLTYDLSSVKTNNMDIGSETNQYIPRILWSPNGKLVIMRLNRLQNHLDFLYANPINGTSQVFYTEENSRFIDETNFNNLTFSKDGSQFLFTSEKDGWLHIYLYQADGKLINQVTKGNWDVTEYIGYDEKNKIIYYQSAESHPTQRDIYVIKTDGTEKRRLSEQTGTNEAFFSSGYQYYINEFSNANTPGYYTLHGSNGKLIRTLEDNAPLTEALKEVNFLPKEFFSFKTDEGIDLNAWMIKPVGFDANKKYPVLMVQYSGPNSQEVLNHFEVGWEQVLAAKGYVVVCSDGRGTGARGEEFRKMTYLQLGKYELADQLATARYLKGLPYIDSSRVGIWGWSFGAFMVLNCMTQGKGTFKAGIAVAPVTNWRYYDNIYTERFMRTPQENPDGYDQNSPITHAAGLQGNLLIIHGTADDNVHWQNTAEMTEALVQANKDFDSFVYTNRNHGIYGGNTRYHLYCKMLKFIEEKL